jgi:hypothetical protein
MSKSAPSPATFSQSPQRRLRTFVLSEGSTLSSQQYTDTIKCGIRDVLDPLTEAVIHHASLKADYCLEAYFWNRWNVVSESDFRMLVQALTMPGKAAKNRVIKILKSGKLELHYRPPDYQEKQTQQQSFDTWPENSNGRQRCVDCGEVIEDRQLFLKKQEDEVKMNLIKIQSTRPASIPKKQEEFESLHLHCWFANLIWNETKGYRSTRTHIIKQAKCARSFLRASYTLKSKVLTTEKDLRDIHTEWITNWRLGTDIKKDATWSYEKEIAAYTNISLHYSRNGTLTVDLLEYLFADFLEVSEIEKILITFDDLKSNSIENLSASRLSLVLCKNTRNLGSLADLPLGTLQICITHPLKENEIKRLRNLGFGVKNLDEGGFVVSRQSLDIAREKGN